MILIGSCFSAIGDRIEDVLRVFVQVHNHRRYRWGLFLIFLFFFLLICSRVLLCLSGSDGSLWVLGWLGFEYVGGDFWGFFLFRKRGICVFLWTVMEFWVDFYCRVSTGLWCQEVFIHENCWLYHINIWWFSMIMIKG